MFKPYNVAKLKDDWALNKRWQGVERPYTAEDVIRLRGTVQIEYTLARIGAERLWKLMHTEDYVHALGALTGNQAVQMVQAGLNAIYLSGWQVAADANGASQTYPDQSLYPADSAPQFGEAHQQRSPAGRPNLAYGKQKQHSLVRPHRGGCRIWLWRLAQRA